MVAALFLAWASAARAAAAPDAAAGSITGVVRGDDRAPAVLADVTLRALGRGTATDENGRFRFEGVPTGSWWVVVRMLGLLPDSVRVEVRAGVEANVVLALGAPVTVGNVREVVVIGSKKGHVVANQIGTRQITEREDIETYRPTSVEEVATQDAGVVNTGGELHLRGGRAEETKLSVSDMQSFNDLRSTNGHVAVGAIASVELEAGGVSPEQGNALSGVINVTTREGGKRFGGDVRWDTDRYADPTKSFDRYDRLSLDAGGPTPVRGLTWFATYEGTFQDGWPPSGMSHPERTLLDFIQLGNRQQNEVNTQWKLAFTPRARGNTTHKFWLEGLGYRGLLTPYIHSWSRRGFVQVVADTAPDGSARAPRYGSWSAVAVDSTYVPMNLADHVPTLDDRFQQLTGSWRWTHDSTWVVNARLARIQFQTTDRVGGKEPWEYEVQSPFYWSGNTTPESENNPYYATHGDYPMYEDSHANSWAFKGDVSTSLWERHLVKAGVEMSLHDVKNVALVVPNGESNGLPGGVRSDFHNGYPQGGVYLHDLWSFEGLILSTGMRFDVFSPGPQVAASELPSGHRLKHQVSPRLGVSYPVSERDALSFHYGWTYQTVSSAALFENRGVAASVATQGNPDLEPETDVAYQVSLQHLFTKDVFGQFSLFFRDIYGLLTVRPGRDAAGNQVSMWTNGDYASARGFELSLARGFSHHFSTDIAYTYSIATGVASDPNEAQQFVNGGQLYLPISERALRWDQRHTLSMQAAVRYPDWGMHLQWGYGSGLPFTPEFRNDRRRDPKLENARRLPSTSRLAVSGDRYLHVWGQALTLFVDARNVLDARNVGTLSWNDGLNPNVNLAGGDDYAIYYTETGRAGGAYLQDTNGDHVQDWVPVHDPRVFEEGRSVRLGLSMRF
jgi:outer membrane receptor protein involved in Fe transport